MRSLSPDTAEHIALQALAFLASDADRLERFVDVTGLRPETLRRAAAQPEFLIGVLDHIASDESLLLSFAETTSLDPMTIATAREVLGGPGACDAP